LFKILDSRDLVVVATQNQHLGTVVVANLGRILGMVLERILGMVMELELVVVVAVKRDS
jgi:hypothetical protein